MDRPCRKCGAPVARDGVERVLVLNELAKLRLGGEATNGRTGGMVRGPDPVWRAEVVERQQVDWLAHSRDGLAGETQAGPTAGDR